METDLYQIRFATLDDAPLLAEMGARAFEQAFGAVNTPEDMQAYLCSSFGAEIQAGEIQQPGCLFIILENQHIPAGYARLQGGSTETCITGANPVELVRIYLLREWIGQGAGSRLMQACLEEALRRRYDVIWLGVWEKNQNAIAFYRKWGFEVVGTHTFQLGQDMQQDLILQKEL
jgi:diamine N-acetyltransferase